MKPPQCSGPPHKEAQRALSKIAQKDTLAASRGTSQAPEVTPSPSWQRIESLLLEGQERDLQLYGVVTHTRDPCLAYRYPPGTCKQRERGSSAFKPTSRDAWDSLIPPAGGTPRIIGGSSGPSQADRQKKPYDRDKAWASVCLDMTRPQERPQRKPLPNYQLDSEEFGPNTCCPGLEPFDALSPDELGAGIFPAGRHHRRRRGPDFNEGKDQATRKLWLPHERERWQRSKRLRFLLKEGLIVFREDALREKFKADFQKYMGRPPKPKEIPWGPRVSISESTDEEDNCEEQNGDKKSMQKDRDGRRNKRTGNEYHKSLFWPHQLEIEDKNDLPLEGTLQSSRSPAVCQAQQDDACPRLHAILESEAIRLHEAADGTLPSIFAGFCKPRKRRHPKDRTISYHQLKHYGKLIDEVTACRMLQEEVRSELTSEEGVQSRVRPRTDHMPTPKGARKNPNYELTHEKLKKAAEKLHVESAPQADMFGGMEKRKRAFAVEPARMLGEGRYMV